MIKFYRLLNEDNDVVGYTEEMYLKNVVFVEKVEISKTEFLSNISPKTPDDDRIQELLSFLGESPDELKIEEAASLAGVSSEVVRNAYESNS